MEENIFTEKQLEREERELKKIRKKIREKEGNWLGGWLRKFSVEGDFWFKGKRSSKESEDDFL